MGMGGGDPNILYIVVCVCVCVCVCERTLYSVQCMFVEGGKTDPRRLTHVLSPSSPSIFLRLPPSFSVFLLALPLQVCSMVMQWEVVAVAMHQTPLTPTMMRPYRRLYWYHALLQGFPAGRRC